MGQLVKSLPTVQESQVQFLGRTESDSTEGTWQQLVFLPGEFHRERSLEGYSP